MKYLVAVSGGIDSVVLLDMLWRRGYDIVVGHVDHGIRGEDSAADARFVKALAAKYNMKYVMTSLHLSATASEAQAREQRYAFLLSEAQKHRATLVTAHHLDDIVETIAINLERGTGWRGLAVLGRSDVVRPLVKFTKQQLYDYATTHRLEWVEDATNQTDDYQRNRMRHRIPSEFPARTVLAELRDAQLELTEEITTESMRLLSGAQASSRYFFTYIRPDIAVELLGMLCVQKGRPRPTRPRLEWALLAIRTAKSGTIYELGDRLIITFTSRTFVVLAV